MIGDGGPVDKHVTVDCELDCVRGADSDVEPACASDHRQRDVDCAGLTLQLKLVVNTDAGERQACATARAPRKRCVVP